MDIKGFKEEFRGKVKDYALSIHIMSLKEGRKPGEVDSRVEESYKKLENWVLSKINFKENVNSSQTIPIVDTTESMDF